MNNTIKTLVILGLAGTAIYLLWKNGKDKDAVLESAKVKDETPPKPKPTPCPDGYVNCTDNPSKCYNPTINYLVDPCKKMPSLSAIFMQDSINA